MSSKPTKPTKPSNPSKPSKLSKIKTKQNAGLVRQIQALLLKAAKLGEKCEHSWTECLTTTSLGRKHVLTMQHVQAVNNHIDLLVVAPQSYTQIFRLHKSGADLDFEPAGNSNFVWASHDSGDWPYVLVSPMLKVLLEQYLANARYLRDKNQIKFSYMNERLVNKLAKQSVRAASPAWLAKFAKSQTAKLAQLTSKVPTLF